MIARALQVILGTVIRTISWFVLVDQIRISLFAQVRNKSEQSLQTKFVTYYFIYVLQGKIEMERTDRKKQK